MNLCSAVCKAWLGLGCEAAILYRSSAVRNGHMAMHCKCHWWQFWKCWLQQLAATTAATNDSSIDSQLLKPAIHRAVGKPLWVVVVVEQNRVGAKQWIAWCREGSGKMWNVEGGADTEGSKLCLF